MSECSLIRQAAVSGRRLEQLGVAILERQRVEAAYREVASALSAPDARSATGRAARGDGRGGRVAGPGGRRVVGCGRCRPPRRTSCG
ncbi:hypothetical protein [Actinomadura bangladeshensis]|uniref:Uncharacterized protein n=1 Tax=Actinomadura bangladeshensis TaxID=453573 RepID=A0A4R4N337_9ACTN|nr:hypothetical protein [Actinomadura bangladeshensis]TDC03129.1 hypothetical protein E1284_38700 [Actinomadura bangladeshensis]